MNCGNLKCFYSLEKAILPDVYFTAVKAIFNNLSPYEWSMELRKEVLDAERMSETLVSEHVQESKIPDVSNPRGLRNEVSDGPSEMEHPRGLRDDISLTDRREHSSRGHQEPRAQVLEEIDAEREAESMRKVEASLFVAGRFLTIQELVALTDVNPLMLRKILSDLSDRYKNSGIEIVQKNELWKMDVAADYTWIVNKLATGSAEFSKAEQETLAIIAYKQPMKQSVLIKIRGNKGYDHVAKFVEMGLVNKKRVGHTAELSLSESFYEYFSVPKGEHLKNFESLEGP